MKKFFVELKDKIVAFAKKSPKKLIALSLAVVLFLGGATTLITVLVGNSGTGVVISNESTRLVLSTSELDGVLYAQFLADIFWNGILVYKHIVGLVLHVCFGYIPNTFVFAFLCTP